MRHVDRFAFGMVMVFIVGSNRMNSGFEGMKTVLKLDRNLVVINSVGF